VAAAGNLPGVSSSDMITESIERLKTAGRDRYREDGELAMRYLRNDMVDDVRDQLQLRMSASQDGSAGQEIFPITVPVAQKFVAEKASLYNRPVERTLTLDDGETNQATKDATQIYNRQLDLAQYNDAMQTNDEIAVMRGAGTVLHEAKHGTLRARVTMPWDVYPVAPESADGMDPADPRDYEGFVVELFWTGEDVGKSQRRTFMYLTREERVIFEGTAPNKVTKILERHPNPFRWVHGTNDANGRYTEADQPGMMMTFWHPRSPIGELLPDTDPTIAFANRELNILFSILFDTMRFQGYAIPVLGLANTLDPKAKRPHGARFPLVLKAGIETADMLTSSVNYTEQVDVLERFVKITAVAMRLSPNEFSSAGVAAQSGFAKLVESLPKIEAREERIARNTFLEEEVAHQRNMAILIRLGHLPANAASLRLQVKFDDIRFPMTEVERAKKHDTSLKHGLTTRAKILASEQRVSLDEAKVLLEEHDAENGAGQEQPPPQAGGFGMQSGMFGARMARPSKPAAKDDA